MNLDILPQLLVNALIVGSIYALASSGLALTYGLLRVLNFAHGHFLMLGAYFYYLFSIILSTGAVLSALGTMTLMLGIGLISLHLFVLPFLRFSTMLTLVSTLALANILEASVSMGFGVSVHSLASGTFAESIEIRGVYITPLQIFIIASALLLLGVIAIILQASPLGRKVRAIAEDPSLSESLGIDAERMRRDVFCLGALLAAFAGVLIGMETNLQPTMGGTYTIKAFAAMILGGLGNFWGTILGSYFLALIENLAVGLNWRGYTLPAGYKDAFAFVAILVVLIVRPDGVFRKGARNI